jgi:hypothetical protein
MEGILASVLWFLAREEVALLGQPAGLVVLVNSRTLWSLLPLHLAGLARLALAAAPSLVAITLNMVAAVAAVAVLGQLTPQGELVAHQFLQRGQAAAEASTTAEHRLAGRAVQLTLIQRAVVERQAAGWQAAQGLPET